MQRLFQTLVVLFVGLACISSAAADDEASNFAHVVAGTYGRCYAKSVPDHVYDPMNRPRQQGRTLVYRVTNSKDVLIQEFNWFSQRFFVKCGAMSNVVVARLGPWHRGHNPSADHLAIAFYKGSKLIKRHSTLDIAGGDKVENGAISKFKNVSASVSHYTVFRSGPQMTKITTSQGAVFDDSWKITATTIDGRRLTFDMTTGELQ